MTVLKTIGNYEIISEKVTNEERTLFATICSTIGSIVIILSLCLGYIVNPTFVAGLLLGLPLSFMGLSFDNPPFVKEVLQLKIKIYNPDEQKTGNRAYISINENTEELEKNMLKIVDKFTQEIEESIKVDKELMGIANKIIAYK